MDYRPCRQHRTAHHSDSNHSRLLKSYDSYPNDSAAGMLHSDKEACEYLLRNRQPVPLGSLFDEKCFSNVCANLKEDDQDEDRVVLDLLRLITPSAENLAAGGLKALGCLKEHVNRRWDACIPAVRPCPQPAYAVGFRGSGVEGVFSEERLAKLRTCLNLGTQSYFAMTPQMYFPFITSEVCMRPGSPCCQRAPSDNADAENAHSMTVALGGVVELFRRIGRTEEIHRRVLGFSISHDAENVRIYAHYPEALDEDGRNVRYYRHCLEELCITADAGRKRWNAHQFVRNVYETFAPKHLERILGAVDRLPGLPSPTTMSNLASKPFNFGLDRRERRCRSCLCSCCESSKDYIEKINKVQRKRDVVTDRLIIVEEKHMGMEADEPESEDEGRSRQHSSHRYKAHAGIVPAHTASCRREKDRKEGSFLSIGKVKCTFEEDTGKGPISIIEHQFDKDIGVISLKET